MEVYGVAIVVAALIVPFTGGSFRALGAVRVRQVWALVAALVIQIALEFDWLPESRWNDVGFALLMASYALLIAFVLVNLNRRGMGVLLIGLLLNTAVVGINRGMPYRAPADAALVTTVKHHPEGPDDLVPFLGDIIVLPAPWDASISFGDLIIAVGVVDFVYWASRRRRVPGEEGGSDGGLDLRSEEPEPGPGPVLVLDDEPTSEQEPVGVGASTTLWSAPAMHPNRPASPGPAWRDSD